jgi:hypothetical protein
VGKLAVAKDMKQYAYGDDEYARNAQAAKFRATDLSEGTWPLNAADPSLSRRQAFLNKAILSKGDRPKSETNRIQACI